MTSNKESKRKPFLVRIYEKALPPKIYGPYSRKQDFRHMLVMLGLCVLLLCSFGSIVFFWADTGKQKVEAELTIPPSGYSLAQEKNVIETLEIQGFSNVRFIEGQGIVGSGTTEMVEQYKESYKKRSVDPKAKAVEDSVKASGTVSVDISEDYSTVRITTFTSTPSSALFKQLFSNLKLDAAIPVFSTWNSMNGRDDSVTIEFIEASTGNVYWSGTASSSNALISNLETKESEMVEEESSQ